MLNIQSYNYFAYFHSENRRQNNNENTMNETNEMIDTQDVQNQVINIIIASFESINYKWKI